MFSGGSSTASCTINRVCLRCLGIVRLRLCWCSVCLLSVAAVFDAVVVIVVASVVAGVVVAATLLLLLLLPLSSVSASSLVSLSTRSGGLLRSADRTPLGGSPISFGASLTEAFDAQLLSLEGVASADDRARRPQVRRRSKVRSSLHHYGPWPVGRGVGAHGAWSEHPGRGTHAWRQHARRHHALHLHGPPAHHAHAWALHGPRPRHGAHWATHHGPAAHGPTAHGAAAHGAAHVAHWSHRTH
mmetsp:Transcript_16186/g.35512  ORF Transcript_16186/g.35512 Transcript_16186/m.35512 type:complete len:243 (-) Transcript_16186:1398-2126(-)